MAPPSPSCRLCDDTGFKDYAGFQMDPCDHREGQSAMASKAISDIAAERERQMSVEGWTLAHDDEHDNGELAAAAASYAFATAIEGRYFAADPIGFWPWDTAWWKPTDARRNLIKAGALIVAEIERLDRVSAAQVETPSDTLGEKA